MIDNPATVARLMDQMKAHLPIPAFPTSQLVRTLREGGLKASRNSVLYIKEIFYFGDEGGISCDVTPSRDAKTAFVVSLTHLRIPPGHPLSRDIRAYQQARIKRIVGSGQ